MKIAPHHSHSPSYCEYIRLKNYQSLYNLKAPMIYLSVYTSVALESYCWKVYSYIWQTEIAIWQGINETSVLANDENQYIER